MIWTIDLIRYLTNGDLNKLDLVTLNGKPNPIQGSDSELQMLTRFEGDAMRSGRSDHG